MLITNIIFLITSQLAARHVFFLKHFLSISQLKYKDSITRVAL